MHWEVKYSIDLGQWSNPLAGAADADYLPLRWCVVDNSKDLVKHLTSGMAACVVADCSALAVGSSFSNRTWMVNASYAFNSYYQQQGQSSESCDFMGMGMITTVDLSAGECRFAICV